MNPRHIAALALVGWYLIVPPPVRDPQGKETGSVSDWLPVAEWDILQSFNSAAECKDYRQNQISWSLKNPELGRTQSAEEQRHLDQRREQLNLSQCIASDDQRFKEK